LWLAYALRHAPPQDESEAKSRRQTRNAATIYAAATALVLFLFVRGAVIFRRRRPFLDGMALPLPMLRLCPAR
ncbi:MAG: hypothetical protein ACRCYS_05030, partial [Beijerinckiaceae bacterium]